MALASVSFDRRPFPVFFFSSHNITDPLFPLVQFRVVTQNRKLWGHAHAPCKALMESFLQMLHTVVTDCSLVKYPPK